MTESRTLASLACRELLAAYTFAIDNGDATRLVELFTRDGVLRRGELTLTGADELPRILDGRPTDLVMRHHLTTVDINVADTGAEAEGRSYYVLYRGRGSALPLDLAAPFSIGDWHSRFVQTDAGWKLSFLEIRRVFANAPATAGRTV